MKPSFTSSFSSSNNASSVNSDGSLSRDEAPSGESGRTRPRIILKVKKEQEPAYNTVQPSKIKLKIKPQEKAPDPAPIQSTTDLFQGASIVLGKRGRPVSFAAETAEFENPAKIPKHTELPKKSGLKRVKLRVPKIADTKEGISHNLPPNDMRAGYSLYLQPELEDHPRCPQSGKPVTHLDIPEFKGDTINLRDWKALRLLTGSAGNNLQAICIREGVRLDFEVLEPNQKIFVYVYSNDESRAPLIGALPSHAYWKKSARKFIPDLSNFNGRANFQNSNNPIVCRHIASYVASVMMNDDKAGNEMQGYFGIDQVEDIPMLVSQSFEDNYLEKFALSKTCHFVSNYRFHEWLSNEFKILQELHASNAVAGKAGPVRKVMLASTGNHTLQLKLKYKPDVADTFVVTFYDPNFTKTHKRRVEWSLESISKSGKPWRFTDFIESRLHEKYFVPGETPVLIFIENDKTTPFSPQIIANFLTPECYQNVYLLPLALRIDNAAMIRTVGKELLQGYENNEISSRKLFNLLSRPNQQFLKPVFRFILSEEWPAKLAAFLEIVEKFAALQSQRGLNGENSNDDLPEDFCIQMLKAPLNGKSAVTAAVNNKSANAIRSISTVLIRMVNKGFVNGHDFIELITDTNQGVNGITLAIYKNQPEILEALGKVLVLMVQKREINRDVAFGFLSMADDDTSSLSTLFLRVCASGWTETLDAYCNILSGLKLALSAPKSSARPGQLKAMPGSNRGGSWAECVSELLIGQTSLGQIEVEMRKPVTGKVLRQSFIQTINNLADNQVLADDHPLVKLREKMQNTVS